MLDAPTYVNAVKFHTPYFIVDTDYITLFLSLFPQILFKGHSRVPVYDDDTIHGILLIKNLIEVDPAHTLTMEQVFQQYGRPLPIVPCNMPLYDLLNDMQTGRCHMAAVTAESELSEVINVQREVKSVGRKVRDDFKIQQQVDRLVLTGFYYSKQ